MSRPSPPWLSRVRSPERRQPLGAFSSSSSSSASSLERRSADHARCRRRLTPKVFSASSHACAGREKNDRSSPALCTPSLSFLASRSAPSAESNTSGTHEEGFSVRRKEGRGPTEARGASRPAAEDDGEDEEGEEEHEARLKSCRLGTDEPSAEDATTSPMQPWRGLPRSREREKRRHEHVRGKRRSPPRAPPSPCSSRPASSRLSDASPSQEEEVELRRGRPLSRAFLEARRRRKGAANAEAQGTRRGGEGSPPPPEQGSEEDASPPFCLPSTSTPVAFPAPLSLAFGPSFSASSASRPASAYSLVARGEHGALEAQRRRTKARKQVETADTHESAHASAEVLGSRRDRRLLRGLGSSANATPAFCPSSHLSEEAFSSSLLSPSADPPPALPSWCARSGVPRRLSSPRVSASSGLHEWRMSSSSAAVPELASRSRSASACLSSDTPRSRFSSPRSSSSSSPSVSPHVAVGRLGCRPGDGLSRELSALSAEGKVPADAGEQHGAVGSREARNVSCSSSRSSRASSLRCQPLSNAAHFPSTPAADAPTRREERQSVKQKNARLLPAGGVCPPSTPYGDAVALPSAFPPSFESFPPPSSARLGFFESHVYIHPTRVPPPERSALPMRGDAVLAASPFSSFPPPSSALLAFVPSRCLPPLAEPSASSAGSPLSSAFSASPLSAFPAADRFSPLCSAASPSSTQRARRRVYVHLVEASSTGAEKTLGTGLGTDANSPEGGAQSGVGEALMAAERRTSQELSHASVFRALRTWRVSSVAHGGVPGEKRGQEKAKGRRRAGSQAPVPAAEGKEGSRSGTEPEGEEKLIERVVEWLVTDRLHATVFLLDGRDRDTGLDGQTRALGAVGAAGEEASRVQREDSSGSSSLSASRVPSQAFPPRSWRHADACLPSLLTRFEGTPPDASTAGAKGGCERESREGTERPPPPGTLQRARAGLSEKIVSRLFKAKARAQEDAADLAFGLSIFLISNTRVVDLLAAPSSLRASSAAASLLSAAVRPSCLACFARLTPQPSSFDSSLHGAASSSSSPSPSPCSSSPASEPDCDPTEGPSKGRGVSNRLLTTFVRTSREAKTLLRGAGRRLSSLLSQSLSSQKEQEDAPHDRTADRRSDAAGRVPQESDEAQERETLLCVRVQVVSLPEPAAPAPAHATLSLLHLVAPVAGEHVQERAALAGRDAPPAKPAPATPQPSSASNFLLAGASCARLTCSSSRWSSRPPAEAASSRASRALLALLRRYLDLPLAAEPPPAPSASVYAHSSRCAQAPAAAPSASLALAASPGRLSFAEELLAPLLARRAKTFALAVLPSHICEPSCDTVALLDTLQRAALHSPRCVPLPLCALAAAAEEDLPSRRARGGTDARDASARATSEAAAPSGGERGTRPLAEDAREALLRPVSGEGVALALGWQTRRRREVEGENGLEREWVGGREARTAKREAKERQAYERERVELVPEERQSCVADAGGAGSCSDCDAGEDGGTRGEGRGADQAAAAADAARHSHPPSHSVVKQTGLAPRTLSSLSSSLGSRGPWQPLSAKERDEAAKGQPCRGAPTRCFLREARHRVPPWTSFVSARGAASALAPPSWTSVHAVAVNEETSAAPSASALPAASRRRAPTPASSSAGGQPASDSNREVLAAALRKSASSPLASLQRGEPVSAAPLAARSSRRRGRLPAAGGSSASAASASRPSSAVALRASLSLRPLPRPRAQAAEKGTWISERLARLGRTPRRLSPPRCGEGSLKESRAQRSSAVRRAASSSLAASRGKTHVSSPRAGASSSVGSSASSGAVSPLDPSTRSSVGARREGSAAPGRPRREAPAASAQSQALQGVAAGPGLATASKSLSRSRLPSPFYPSSRSETQRRLLAASASSAPARPLRPQQASASPLHRELLGPSSSACVARFASSSASPSISFHASARDQPQAAASRERGKEPTAVSEELHRRLHSPAVSECVAEAARLEAHNANGGEAGAERLCAAADGGRWRVFLSVASSQRKRELVMQLQNGEREADSETPPGTGASRNGERRERAGSQSAAEDESALGEEGAERRRTRRRKSTLSSPYTEETVPEEERKAANADRQENKSQILPKYLSAKPLLPCGARPRAAPAGLDSALCSSVSSSSASLSSSSCTASCEGLTRSPIPRHQSPQSRALRGVRTPQRVELARPPADALGSVEDSQARPRAAGELFERGRHGRGRRLSSPLAHLAGAGCIDPLALRSSSFYAAQRDLAPAAEDVQPWVSPSERLARAAKGARLAADAFEEGRAHEASDAATGRRTRGQKEGKLRGATSEKRARARREPAEASEWSRGQAGGRRLAAAFAEKETPGRGLRAKEDAEASHPRLASDPRRTGRARGRGQADNLREEETLLRVREADLQLEIVRLRGLLRRALAGHSQSRETSQSEAGEEDAFQRMEQIDGYEQALEQSRDALRALRQRCTPSRNPPVASPGCLSPSALPSPRTPSATLALRPSRVSPSRGLSRSPDPSPLRARAPAERAGRQVAPAGPQAGKASRESLRTPSSAVAALARDARPAVKTLLVAPRTAARDLSRGLRRGAPPASAASSCGAASGHGSATAETPRKGGNSRERDKAGAGGDAARRGRVRRSQSLPAGGSSEARSLQGPGSPPPTLSRKRPPRERACCRDLRQVREGRLRSLQAAHDAGATPRRRDPSEFAALAAFLSRHGPPHSQCVACLPSTPSDSPVQASPAALSHERLRPFREATHTTSLALASASSSASPSSPYAYSTRLDGCLACSPSARRRRHEDGADSRRVSPTRARDVREATAAAERAEAVRRREVRAGELKRRRDAQQSLAPSRMEANALEGRPEITCGDTEPPRLSLGRGRVSQGFASEGTSQDAGQRPTALTGLSQEDERRLYKHMPQNLLLLYKSMARRNGAASAETATAEAASHVPSVRCAAREDTREAAVSPSLRKAQPAAGSTSRAAGGEEAEETEDSLRTPRGVLKAEKLRETGRQNCRHASPLRYGGSGAVTLFERRRSCEVEKPVASVRPETSLSRARSLSSSPRARRVTTPAEDGTHRARLLAMRTAGRPLSLCPRTGALAATRQGSRPTAQRHLEASCHSAQTRLSGEAGGLQWTCRAGSPPRGARAGKLCGAETRRAGRGTESGGRLLRDGSSARSRREGATDKKQAEAVTRALQSPVSMNAVEKNAKKLLQRMQHELGRSAPTLLPVQAKLQSLVEQLVAGCSERDDRVRHLVQLLCVSQKAASPPLSPSLCSPRQSGRLAQSRAQAPAAAVARRSTPGVRLSSRHPGGRTTMPAALEASRQWSPMKQNCY